MNDQFVVFKNQRAITEATEGFNESLPAYQKVVSEFAMLNCGQLETTEQFIEAVTDPKAYLSKSIEARLIAAKTPLSFAGVMLKPSAVVAMADDTEHINFITAAAAAKPVLLFFKQLGRLHRGKIEIDKNLLDGLIRSHTIMAISDDEREILKHLRSIVDGVNGLVKMKKIDDFNIGSQMIAHYVHRIGMNNFILNPVMFTSLTRH